VCWLLLVCYILSISLVDKQSCSLVKRLLSKTADEWIIKNRSIPSSPAELWWNLALEYKVFLMLIIDV